MGSTNEVHKTVDESKKAEKENKASKAKKEAQQSLAPIALEFQPDAIEIEERPVPRASRWTLYALVSIVIFTVLWSIFSHVDRVVTSRGKLITTDQMIVLQPLETSVIRKIHVAIGDTVEEGETLVTLDSTFTAADVSQLEARRDSIQAQINRLQAEIDGVEISDQEAKTDDERLQQSIFYARQSEYKARLDAFRDKLSNIEATIETNRQEREGLQEREKLLGEIETMFNQLHSREHGSRLKLLQAIEQKLVVKNNLTSLTAKAAELKEQASSLKAEQAAFLEEWNRKTIEELVENRRELARVSEELSKAIRRSSLITVKAPADGVVLEIAQRSIGSVIREAEPLVTLVPSGVKLQAEVDVEPSNIGYIDEGNAVRLKLDAFPFQRHGTIDGLIKTISENTVKSEGPGADESGKPLAPQRPVYRVRVDLEERHLRNLPEHFRLIPGMTLAAEIKVGKRRVISYFLYPFLKGLDESIKEP